MTEGTWLVERGLRAHDGTVDEWQICSGSDRKKSAQAEARQCGPRWRRMGYAVRVRFEAAA